MSSSSRNMALVGIVALAIGGVLGYALKGSAQPPQPPQPPPAVPAKPVEKADRWSTLKTEYYQLLYHPDHEKDAKKVKQLLDDGVAALKKEFADFPVDRLLRVDCKVYVHPRRNARASENMVAINSGGRGDSYSAVIDLLTPSAYDSKYRSNINEPAGDDYWSKLVVHEYSTVLLERITLAKKSGWHFFDAPRWFVDGYEEYLGLMLSTPRNRKEVLAKYLAMHKDDPDRIDFGFGLTVKDAYIDGALLLLFMHETFGKERVQAILSSEERRFGKAITAALGVRLDEFQKRWEVWLKTQLK